MSTSHVENAMMTINAILAFDGNERSFAIWNQKFMALATLKGFAPALNESFKSELPDRHDATLRARNKRLRKVMTLPLATWTWD